jgi:hypothetical protein
MAKKSQIAATNPRQPAWIPREQIVHLLVNLHQKKQVTSVTNHVSGFKRNQKVLFVPSVSEYPSRRMSDSALNLDRMRKTISHARGITKLIVFSPFSHLRTASIVDSARRMNAAADDTPLRFGRQLIARESAARPHGMVPERSRAWL